MHNKLKVLFWNARGIKNKFQELVEYIERENIDIIGINETFLTDTVLLPHTPNYTHIRADETNH